MIELKNVTIEDIEDTLILAVEPWQTKYFPSVAEHIARAYVEPEHLVPLLITKDSKPVGFLQFRFDREHSSLILENFMIDAKLQKQGFGMQGLRAFTEFAETMGDFQKVRCFVDMGNLAGRKVLENSGFMRGSVKMEERINEMIYILR